MTAKTSEVLAALEAEKQSLLKCRESIVLFLEDDARIEDVQDLYGKAGKDMLAKALIQEHTALLTAHPMVLEKCREIVDIAEGIYRLVK